MNTSETAGPKPIYGRVVLKKSEHQAARHHRKFHGQIHKHVQKRDWLPTRSRERPKRRVL